jgi:hypothetical protein
MAPFSRTSSSEQSAHSASDSALTTNHFTKIIWRNVQFQYQRIPIITNFAHLYSRRVINQRLSNILN